MRIIISLIIILVIFSIISLTLLYINQRSVYISTLIQHSVDKSEAIKSWREQRWYVMKKSIQVILSIRRQ